jgi:enolase-phosphatase E1
MSVNTLVLDIEGTVCPIMFVKETLFPYFLAKLPLVLELIVFPLGPSEDGNLKHRRNTIT